MTYHPLMGISIFFLAIIVSFFLGKSLIRKSLKSNGSKFKMLKMKPKKSPPPKGEITSPDAPWLKDK